MADSLFFCLDCPELEFMDDARDFGLSGSENSPSIGIAEEDVTCSGDAIDVGKCRTREGELGEFKGVGGACGVSGVSGSS